MINLMSCKPNLYVYMSMGVRKFKMIEHIITIKYLKHKIVQVMKLSIIFYFNF